MELTMHVPAKQVINPGTMDQRLCTKGLTISFLWLRSSVIS